MARILIVDDSTVMRKNLYRILMDSGHEVIGEAVDGRQAVLMYLQLKPDLVTMDITMPKLSGVEAVSQIISKDVDAKIIMVSALNQKQMVFEALNNGAKHYIIKPIEASTLLGIINEVLSTQMDTISDTKEDNLKVKPGFKIDNVEGKFVIYFNENIGVKDSIDLDTAIKGLLFIKPLYTIFDLGNLENIQDEVLYSIKRICGSIKNSGGYLEYKGKSKELIEKLK